MLHVSTPKGDDHTRINKKEGLMMNVRGRNMKHFTKADIVFIIKIV